MPLTLQKFFPAWNVADPSAPCIKVESFLRLHDIPYDVSPFTPSAFKGAPKGRIPYITTEMQEKIGDSTMIINYLAQHYKIDPHGSLNKKDRATAHAFCAMMDDILYHTMVYSRWVDPRGWATLRDVFFSEIPFFIRPIIENMQQKQTVSRMKQHGCGLNTADENYTIANDALTALSDLLGNDTWFFNQKTPTLIDIVCHAYVSNLVYPEIDTDLNLIAKKFDKLAAHTDAFQKLIYSDLEKK